MKIFSYRKHGVSKGFLIAASSYRRHALSMSPNMDFSVEALVAQYEHETYGETKPDMLKNGYTYGKSILDIGLAAYAEDYTMGLFTKNELAQGAPFFVRRFLKTLMPVSFVGYEYNLRLRNERPTT